MISILKSIWNAIVGIFKWVGSLGGFAKIFWGSLTGFFLWASQNAVQFYMGVVAAFTVKVLKHVNLPDNIVNGMSFSDLPNQIYTLIQRVGVFEGLAIMMSAYMIRWAIKWLPFV